MRRTSSVWLAFAWLAFQAAASAEPERSEPLVVAYVADGDCPDVAEFERRVRTRLAKRTLRSRAIHLHVRLARADKGVKGTLAEVGQATSARELSASSCSEAADALALVAALMLSDARAESSSADRTHDEPRAARRARARSGSQPATVDGSGISAEDLSRAQPATNSDLNDGATASAPSPNPGATSTPSTPVGGSASARLETRRARLFSDWGARVSVSGLLVSGTAARLRTAPSISLGIIAHPRSGPRLALELGARAAFPHEMRTPDGKAELRWLALATSLCLEGPSQRFSFAGCAQLETGWIAGRGRNGASQRERTRFWGAVGPRLAASVLLHRLLGLRLGGELLAVLVRDRFLLADRVLYSVPRLALRAELGLYFVLR